MSHREFLELHQLGFQNLNVLSQVRIIELDQKNERSAASQLAMQGAPKTPLEVVHEHHKQKEKQGDSRTV